MTAVARPFGGGWVWQVLVGGLAVVSTVRLATLGFSAWAESVRRDYGLSTRSWGGWAADVAKGFGLQVAGTLLAVLLLVALARVLPRWWWVPGAVAAAALVVALSFVYPLVIEPVFNRFSPLEEGELRTSLLRMAEDDGVPVEDVLVADASRRTSTLNAYVSGFGATRRIVVYDTLLDQAPAEQVRTVVAHELGHAAEHDVRNGTLLGALLAAAGVCALGGLLGWTWLHARAGADGAHDPRVLVAVLAIVGLLGFLTAPLQALVSRRIETRADVHSWTSPATPRPSPRCSGRWRWPRMPTSIPRCSVRLVREPSHRPRAHCAGSQLGRHERCAGTAGSGSCGRVWPMSRTLVVTNDFPTRQGGIESFVYALADRLPVDEVVVYTAAMPGDREFDALLPFSVVRDPTSMLLPTPAVARRTADVLRAENCDSVLFGAAAPLGLLADRLRQAGARRVVGLTHGHETWWAKVPVARHALGRIGTGCDVLTYVSEFCRRRIATALSDDVAARMVRLAPGVDTQVFRPGSAARPSGNGWASRPIARSWCRCRDSSTARGRTR